MLPVAIYAVQKKLKGLKAQVGLGHSTSLSLECCCWYCEVTTGSILVSLSLPILKGEPVEEREKY